MKLLPLTNLLQTRTKKVAVIFLSPAELLAFDPAMDSLVQSILLTHPVINAKLCLTVDAPNFAVGTISEQTEWPYSTTAFSHVV